MFSFFIFLSSITRIGRILPTIKMIFKDIGGEPWFFGFVRDTAA
jgi:hypothetical protein